MSSYGPKSAQVLEGKTGRGGSVVCLILNLEDLTGDP